MRTKPFVVTLASTGSSTRRTNAVNDVVLLPQGDNLVVCDNVDTKRTNLLDHRVGPTGNDAIPCLFADTVKLLEYCFELVFKTFIYTWF